MAEKYWLGGFFIDASRNQITYNNQSQTLPPKALAVLTYLAEHQGKVVSQDDLLDNVWKDTVVAPNTLQRCIAQLRKALGDDGKEQNLIKTHAKRGYSLECHVRWQDDNLIRAQQSSNESESASEEAIAVNKPVASATNRPPKTRIYFALLSIVAIAGLIWVNTFLTMSDKPFVIKDIRPVTSTDNRELASIYSPDGKYVVFKRYPEVLCVNNLWAKNIETQEEFQLTDDLGSYESLTFSSDGKTLAFIRTEDCRAPVTQNDCYLLQSLDFEEALTSPRAPKTLMECKHSQISSAIWLNEDEIAMLQKQTDKWQLISYSLNEQKSNVIYESEEGNLITYDYSPRLNLIALVSVQGDSDFYIHMLEPSGELVSHHRIQYPDEIAKYRYIYPNFSVEENHLIFSTGRQLFSLSFEGVVQKIAVPLDQAIGTPVAHPDGRRMLAIKGYYDSDIITVPIHQFSVPNALSDDSSIEYAVLNRSTHGEDYAKFQPDGEQVAFWSNRSGSSQIWITDGKNARQLSRFPLDTRANQFAWAMDGQSILINGSSELKQIFLDGRESDVGFSRPISQLYHWDSINQTALAKVWIQGVAKFGEINLVTGSFRVLNNKQVEWAAVSKIGKLVYMDNMDRFWLAGGVEDQLIPLLDGQGSPRHFIIKDETVYGINNEFQLWSFDLETNMFSIMAELPNTIDYITDIDAQQMLMTMRIAGRKEVVELLLD